MSFYKLIFILFLTFYIFGCSEKTTLSGKILTLDDLNIKINNKNDLIKKFGEPSYIDQQLNKYFYFTQKDKNKTFFDNKTLYSYLIVFELDNNKVINKEAINLLDIENHKYENIVTENNIIDRGFIEKIFGGVGPDKIIDSQ